MKRRPKLIFDIPAEQLRTSEYYSEEYEGYFSPYISGRGYSPSLTLENYTQQNDLLILNLSIFWMEDPPLKMALTVRLTYDGYQYLSYLPR